MRLKNLARQKNGKTSCRCLSRAHRAAHARPFPERQLLDLPLFRQLSSGRWAIGRVVMNGHRHTVIIRPLGKLLVMDVLHDPGLLRSSAWLEAELQPIDASKEELQLAAMLIDSASGAIDWRQFRDDTPDKLSALVAAKVAGQEVLAPTDEPVQVIQLLDALKQSVAQAQSATTSARPAANGPRRRRSA